MDILEEKIKKVSLNLPTELLTKVEKEAKENTRNTTQQIIHIIKKYYDLKEK